MSKFLLSFHGGKPAEDPDEQAASMQAWNDWYGELGDSLVDGGDAVGSRATIHADGSVTHGDGHGAAVTGYAVISADSLHSAIDLAKGSPILESAGSVEVGQLLGMTDQSESEESGELAEVGV